MSTKRVRNYEIGKLKGSGSFGQVRLGRNLITNHEVAVKILDIKQLRKQKMMEKMKREIHISKMFDHPHVNKLFEYFDFNSKIFLIFECIPGGELFQLIWQHGHLEEGLARKYFQQIVYAVKYVHELGISHRDLKPENILLDKDHNIKLIDFGLSNITKDGRGLKTFWGTPNYASPEIIEGNEYDGTQIDVWSLGVVLYVMLFGEYPFDDENNTTLWRYIREAKYYIKGNTAIEAKDLLNKMLQPNIYKRITIEQIIEHPWFNKISLPKYLQDPFLGHRNRYKIDQKIFDRLFSLDLGLDNSNKEAIKQSIIDSQMHRYCIIYEHLVHFKMMNKLNNPNRVKPIKRSFENISLENKQVQSINKTNKRLLNLNVHSSLSLSNFIEKQGKAFAWKDLSFHTSSSSNNDIQQMQRNEFHKNIIGFAFKADLDNLFKKVFTVLKDQRMVWKRWKSDYVYKCETGIPISNKNKKNSIKQAKDDDVKFFLHFSLIPRKKQSYKAEFYKKPMNEYLVSLIWIRGKTLKYLDLIHAFKNAIQDIL